ncbi:hypothetical protein K8T06_04630 [bacterium]|nr:hypothetical protein [bacterium]
MISPDQNNKTHIFNSVLFSGILWTICLIAILSTIWIPNYLPFTDYPVHLSLIQVSDIPARAEPIAADRFETNWWTPYAFPYYMARIIAIIFPIEITGKILLSLYLILTPLSTARLLKSLNKPPVLALATFPLLINFNLSWGFVPFLISIPLMLESINQCIRFIRTPLTYRWILFSSALVLLFFTHLFALLIALVLCAGITVGSLIYERKTAFLCLIAMVPALLITFFWRSTLKFSESDLFFLQKGVRYSPVIKKLQFFSDFIISGDPGTTSRLIFSVFIILLIIRAIPSKKLSNNCIQPSRQNKIINLSSLSLLISICMFYIFCPYSWLTAVWLFNRVAFLIPIMFLTMLPRKGRIPFPLWSITVSALTVWLCCHTTLRHLNFNTEIIQGIEVINQIPPGKSVRYIPSNPRSAFSDHEPYEHFGQYYQIHRNGYIFNPFATLIHLPVRYIPYWLMKFEGFQPGAIHVDKQLKTDLKFDSHEYFLLRLSPVDTPERIAALFLKSKHQLPELISQKGPWILLRKPGIAH